ncbi:MAG TPA: DUF4340 domain-containing protein, partial [Planctomycetes bacterium]|nr:DUF4340 domain-containing protein [Planctomycetota bacterium]
GYPVDFTKVKELVLSMARLEIAEPKTSKPEYFARLGVEAPDAEGSDSTLVTLMDGSGESLASLVIGKAGKGGRGVLVRPADQDQVYLCKERLSANTQPTSWIDREILRLESDRVQSISIQHTDGPDVEIARDPENHTQFKLLSVPEGREPTFPGVANGVGTAVSYLGLDDVRPSQDLDLDGGLVATTTYRCTDGLQLTIRTSKVEDETWIRVAASFEEPEVVGPMPETEGDDEADSGEDDAMDPDKVRAEVEELNARLSGWAFQIPQYKADVIGKKLEDLLRKEGVEDTPAILADPDHITDPESAVLNAPDPTAGERPAFLEEDTSPETSPPDLPGEDMVQNPLEGLEDTPLLPTGDEPESSEPETSEETAPPR